MSKIKFLNGLSCDKIVNDVENQGQYKWLLEAKTKDLVVGLSCDGGLSIKSGTWLSGTFNG